MEFPSPILGENRTIQLSGDVFLRHLSHASYAERHSGKQDQGGILMQQESKSTVSRRTFLTGAAATGALAALGAMAGCSPKAKGNGEAIAESAPNAAGSTAQVDWLGEAPQIDDADCTETLDFDVLVVGAGTSGYFAAASAAESGLKTLLIEKSTAGNSVRSSALGAVNSKQQQEHGVSIEPADIVNDMDHYARPNRRAPRTQMGGELRRGHRLVHRPHGRKRHGSAA